VERENSRAHLYQGKTTPYVILVAAVAASGGLLFGASSQPLHCTHGGAHPGCWDAAACTRPWERRQLTHAAAPGVQGLTMASREA